MQVNSGSKGTEYDKDMQNNNDVIAEDDRNNHVDMDDLFSEYAYGTSLKKSKGRVTRNGVDKEVESLMSELLEECRSEANKIELKSKQNNSTSSSSKYSMSACCFCQFTHSNTLFVITHEVVHHQHELLNVIHRTEIHSRYSHKTFNKELLCSLCYCKVGSPNNTKHLLSHAKHSRFPCNVCTFSSENAHAHRNHAMVHSRQKDRDVNGFKEALDYVRSEGGIDNISPATSVDRSTNKKQSGNLKRPRISNGINTFSKVIKIEGSDNDRPMSGNDNNIRSKCLFCAFTHTSEIYTLTHEIISHRDEVKERFENDHTKKDALMRYSFQLKRGSVGACRLCGSSNFTDRLNHTKSHIIAQTHECKYCTYSKGDRYLLKAHARGHMASLGRNERYLAAKIYAREGGLGCAVEQSGSTNIKNKDKIRKNDGGPDLDVLVTANSDTVGERKCNYCNFYHKSDVVIFTHEVLIHTNEIRDQVFRKDVRSRYIVSTKGSCMCHLCGCSFSSLCEGRNMKKHLLHHLVSGSSLSKTECDYCTFAGLGDRYPIKHVLMHDKEGESCMDKEIFLAAKRYVRGGNNSDVNMAVEVGKVIIKVKNEMKQEKAGKSGKVPLQKMSTPKPGGSNISSYKCNYCSFTHSNQVFTLTHEVVLHGHVICSSLSSPNHSDILTRFSGNWPEDVVFLVCLLCGSPRPKDDKKFTIHLKHHAYPQHGNQCKTCTYSNRRHDHLHVHASFHYGEDDRIKAKIKELRVARDFVIGYNGRAHIDANQPSTSAAPDPQQYINETQEHNDSDNESSVKDIPKREPKCKKGRKSREGDKGNSSKTTDDERSTPNNHQLPPGCPKPSVIYILNCPTPSSNNNNSSADPRVIFLSPTATSCCCSCKTGGEKGRAKIMECPICDFMCNDQKVILLHISSTH